MGDDTVKDTQSPGNSGSGPVSDANEHLPGADTRLLVDAKEAAFLLSISKSHFFSLLSAEFIPPPIRLGRSARWGVDELRDWVKAGCLPQHQWQEMKQRRGKEQPTPRRGR